MSQSTLHYEQGKLMYQNKKFSDAIFQFTEAIRLGPETPSSTARCYNARGVVYFYLGEFRKVIKDCTKALELDPDNANYYNCRGNAYFSLGKFNKAAEDFSKAIELSPQASHGRYYNNRGSAYRRLKMFKEAIDDYTRAIAVDPKNGNYYNNRGNTYFDMGEFQLAIDDFTTALGLEPYSPKTKLTLAQAHEALAQEKRMKNASEFTGLFSHLKISKEGKRTVQRRKDRPNSSIYVSPMGVEVQFVRGWRKRVDQSSFAWSEDMKIELVDDQAVKLYLDASRNTYVVISQCDATAVEEELIGRITTKFASYSTACLVAQHEGVVQEYTGIVASIRATQEGIQLLRSVRDEAEKQKEDFVKDDKFDEANKSKEQVTKLEEQIKMKQAFMEDEKLRAEAVRQRAEQEAGPVLDMVLIMQNRVAELYQTKVRNAPERYQVDDLSLKEQVGKMDVLVNRARELGHLVARPVDEVTNAMERVAAQESDDEYEDDDEDYAEFEEAAPAAAAAPASVEAAAPAAAAAATEEGSEDESDWDDIDEGSLPNAFAASGGEVFMTVESANGMVTITPSGQNSGNGMVLVKKDSLANLTAAQTSPEELAELQAASAEAEKERLAREEAVRKMEETSAALQQVREEMVQLRAQNSAAQAAIDSGAQSAEQNAASEAQIAEARSKIEELQSKSAELEVAAAEKDAALASLKSTQEELERMKEEQVMLTAQLAEKQAALEQTNSDLSGRLEMTAKEQEEREAKMAEQEREMREIQARLVRQKEEMHEASTHALSMVSRVKELEQREEEYNAQLEAVKEQSAEEKARIEAQKKELADQLAALEDDSKAMLDDLEGVKKEREELASTVNEQASSLAEMRKHLASVQAQLAKASAEASAKAAALDEEKKAKEEAAKKVSVLEKQAAEEEAKRRQLHNIIQEIKGNIRVYCRIRPAKADQKHDLYRSVVGSDDRGLKVVGPAEKSSTGGKAKSKTWDFEFDRIFWPRHQQADVFNEISQLVQSALDGYKVSIFAYGQTGAGKTFTMEGPDNYSHEMRGVIPRSVEQIFQYAESMQLKGWKYEVRASFLEIYNTDIHDLLNYDASAKHEIKMIKDGKVTRTVVSGLTEQPVSSAADVGPLIELANKNRTSAATDMNERSSRSHSVFTLKLVGVHEQSGQQTEGLLNLVDLAGSERVEKSGAQGQRFEEAKAINSSLTCLGDVIASLARNDKHVPFRNSKLTYLLQDCFGSGSKTLMFINLAAEETSLQESVCSLRFGAKVHETQIGPAKKQVKAVKKKKPVRK